MALGAHELCGQIRQFLSDHGSDPQYRRATQALRDAESTLSATYDAQPKDEGDDKSSPPDFTGAKDRAKEYAGAADGSKDDNESPFQKRMRKRDKAAA